MEYRKKFKYEEEFSILGFVAVAFFWIFYLYKSSCYSKPFWYCKEKVTNVEESENFEENNLGNRGNA